tara:strand:+ start:172 stop:387 length:216 start_codon:yes stop_codon:yes gene_type:complete
MKNFSFLILAFSILIALPSYSNPINEKNNFIMMRKRFERVDLSSHDIVVHEDDPIDKTINCSYNDPTWNYF